MAHVENVVGRYIHLTIAGVKQRIYFEEAGTGIPLLCLHTAGADSRQYRHLLDDPEITRSFRVIAFDLPWHGKSLPPDRWWEQEYLLTADVYASTVETFCNALALDRPVVVGCSMAGSLVLELVRRDAKAWRCAIGLSGAANVAGRFQDWSLAPDINAQQSVASWTSSLMAPMSPEQARREVWWIYSQGGPGIYRGDTYFYSVDLDLRGHEAEIDTSVCPVYLLTGEYDHACTVADTEQTLAAIPGAKGGAMIGIGHFPVSENYPLFKTYLLPILQEVLG
jgi:pimeloyl-ACP methyl ester carboxylesterase